MDARRPTWTFVSIAMILALLLTAVMPGLPVGGARAAAQEAGKSPVTPGAPESEITLNPIADATISVVSPDVNFGSDALLGTAMGYQTMSQPESEGATGAGAAPVAQAPEIPAWEPAQRALLRFDLGLPAGAVIDATQLNLKLSVSGGADSVVLRAYQVTSDWLEARVTWNNKPTPGSLYAQTTVGAGVSWYAWDVTEIARAWQQGPNYGLLLEPTAPTEAPWSRAFSSRDAGAEPPQLVVTYHLPGPTLYAPPTGRPGAELPVAGQNYTPGAAITLQLASGGSSWTCGSASADAAGTLRTICTVPLAAPIGAATLNARALTGNLLASTAVQIVAGPTLQLTPGSGPPGTVVQYAVTNLVAGSLRLDYAGVPLVGPRPVMGGSASGSFVVPADRPSPLGSATAVRAVNIAGKLAAGAAQAVFQSQTGASPLSFQFTSATASGAHLAPGELFTVNGHVNLDAGAAIEGYQVVVMWQDGAGHSVPISIQPGKIAADGTFQVRVRAPSLLLGDAWSNVGLLEGLFVAVGKPGYEESADIKTVYNGPFAPELPVHVTSSTGGEIENAVVRILDYPGYDKPTQNATNQTHDWTVGQLGDSDLQAYICSKPWQKTTKAGNVLVELPALEGLAINPDYENWNPALSVEKPALPGTAASAATLRGTQPAAPAQPPPKQPPTGPQWKHLTITVNALLSGFGLKGADGKWYGYHTDVYFNTQTGQIVDAWSQSLGTPLEVVLDPIPGGEIPFEFSPVELTAGIQEPSSDPTVYGKFLSFAGVTGSGVTLPQDLADLRIAIPWTLNDYVAKVRVELGGQVILEADPLKYPTPGMCSTTEPLVGEWGIYDLTIPYPTTIAAGLHELKVIVKLKTGAEVTRLLKLRFVDAPAWFRTSAASQRWAGWDEVNEAGKWKVVGYKLREDLVAADNQAVEASSTLADTPNSGPVTNKATLSSSHIEKIGFGGDISATAESKAAKMTALNQPAKDRDDKAWAQPTASVSIQSTSAPNSGYTIPIDYGPVELYNTGTLPLFAGAFTLWEIVQVTYVGVGGSSANLSMNGSVTVGDAPSIDLTMMPEARVWGTCTLGASFLAVVAAVKAELSADLNARLKLKVHDYDVDVNGVCFMYQGGNRFWAGLICFPGTEICVLDDEKRITWPPFQAGSCNGAAEAATLAAPTASPPTVGAALASDGFGHSAVLWPGDRSALTAAFYDGATWSATHTIPTGLGPAAPALAFFAPDRAIAAWAESSLPLSTSELPPSAYNDVLRSYHIATSVWDGSAWSAPQDLTLPTTPGTGEGKVALAACPATAAGCPAGGAVTAVWVRDVAGDSALRQFRLYYATYQDGHWSAPLPVDASSTGTDMQPSVAYRLGKPVVAWVRDADRSLDTVADRRIVWRVLDGASPAVVPAGLPEGIVYIDLSVDSAGVPQLAFTRVDAPGVSLLDSRHPLHYAWGACTGATCTWSWQKLQDSHGRTLQAEQPRLTVDKLNRPTITYRALGLGPDPAASPIAYPEDTAGVIARTGDLAQVELPAVIASQTDQVLRRLDNPAAGQTATVSPSYLTSDGAVNWEPLAAYDALSNSTIALAVRGPAPAGAASLAAHLQKVNIAQAMAAGEPFIAANVARLSDFAVVTATVSSRYPAAGQPLALTVALRNDGVGWQGASGQTLNLVATWDGGPGLGAVAASTGVTALAAGEVVTLDLLLTAPPPVAPGAPAATYAAPHTLTVTVNPNQPVAERNGANNSITLPVGGLPAPQHLTAAATGSAGVLLQWEAPAAGAVAGYRVYRATDGGPSLPAGSSFVTGWVDVTAQPGHRYQYAVVSYAANGLEGEPSAVRQVTLPAAKAYTYLPLVLRMGR